MTEEYLMSSADRMAGASMAAAVLSAVEAIWETRVGPACACFIYRTRQGPDTPCVYASFAPFRCDAGGACYGVRDCTILPELMSDATLQYARFISGPALWTPLITPETHFLMWRSPPEIERRSEYDPRWYGFMRLGFMPKDAWILDFEGTEKLP